MYYSVWLQNSGGTKRGGTPEEAWPHQMIWFNPETGNLLELYEDGQKRKCKRSYSYTDIKGDGTFDVYFYDKEPKKLENLLKGDKDESKPKQKRKRRKVSE